MSATIEKNQLEMFTATTKYMENNGPEMIFFRIEKK